MFVLTLTVQLALPLALLLWLGLWPARNVPGLAAQAAGTGAVILALALVAQWAVVGWWVPWVLAGLWGALVLAVSVRAGRAHLAALPDTRGGWGVAVAGLILLTLGGWATGTALAGRTAPPGPVVGIANPLGPGRYLVGNGGAHTLVNVHLHTLDDSVARYRPWRGQSHAIDFFGLGPWGLRADGLRPADPAAYAIFGKALHAPCNGTVIAAEDTRPDFEVPRLDPVNRLGNHVILACGGAWIVLAHMQQGSVTVTPGDTVTQGRRIGAVGNSGASTEPHLHIHAQRPAAEGAPPISGAPLPLRIADRYLVRGDRLDGRSP
ncbi:peptidoglycan DD-metalloendopeptidase family protein [Roseovarius ramblicola]|uniref:Peptidoglycan DD-metalloendopeptidase family protein n=1 Tax=Roseovarius ramblicola TaxID=2022336 RepID=A0ABV5HY05_9RHOB